MQEPPFPTKAEGEPSGRALVADIGGTNARFAMADLDTLELASLRQFRCDEQPDLISAALDYARSVQERPRFAAIGVAAPVVGGEIAFTNSPWRFAKSELRTALGLDGLLILNDFEALALSLPHLKGEELHRIGGGEAPPLATKVVLGPGTGIGVAGLQWSGSGWTAISGEGGHIALAAQSPEEFALVDALRAGRERVSVERALSGPGLADLYLGVAKTKGQAVEPLPPGEIVDRAFAGADAIAVETLSRFVTWLGRFAGDVALMFGARGGVYLGGGIAPRIRDMLSEGAFRAAFEDKGRMRGYLAPVPVYVILDAAAALKGAAAGLRAALARDGGTLATSES